MPIAARARADRCWCNDRGPAANTSLQCTEKLVKRNCIFFTRAPRPPRGGPHDATFWAPLVLGSPLRPSPRGAVLALRYRARRQFLRRAEAGLIDHLQTSAAVFLRRRPWPDLFGAWDSLHAMTAGGFPTSFGTRCSRCFRRRSRTRSDVTIRAYRIAARWTPSCSCCERVVSGTRWMRPASAPARRRTAAFASGSMRVCSSSSGNAASCGMTS